MWDFEEEGDEPVVVIEQRTGSASSFMWGILIGAGVALLLAPSSGEETRRRLARSAKRARDAAQETAEELTDKVVDRYEYARQSVEERIDSARRTLEIKKNQASEALRAGKEAAQHARQDLERRIAQSKAAFDAAGEAPTDGGEVVEEVADERPTRRRRNG